MHACIRICVYMQKTPKGKPILIDLLNNRAGTFVVSRIPLRDDGGEVIGVLGIVLFDHPETTLQPLITKFARLEQDLGFTCFVLADEIVVVEEGGGGRGGEVDAEGVVLEAAEGVERAFRSQRAGVVR